MQNNPELKLTFDNLWTEFDEFLYRCSTLSNQTAFQVFTQKLQLFDEAIWCPTPQETAQFIFAIELIEEYAGSSEVMNFFTGYTVDEQVEILRLWVPMTRLKRTEWLSAKLLGQRYQDITWI